MIKNPKLKDDERTDQIEREIKIDETPLNALKLAELPEDQAVLDSADEDDEFGEKRDDKEKVWRRRERPLLKVKMFEIYTV